MINYFSYIPIILWGWILVFLRLIGSIVNIWLNQKSLIKVLSITLFLQFVFSARQWFFYEIQLTDIKETISVSSKSNLYFILSTLACFFISFQDSKKLNLVAVSLQIFQGVLFVFGESRPEWIHIDFLEKADYQNSLSYFSYAICLILNSILFFIKFI